MHAFCKPKEGHTLNRPSGFLKILCIKSLIAHTAQLYSLKHEIIGVSRLSLQLQNNGKKIDRMNKLIKGILSCLLYL